MIAHFHHFFYLLSYLYLYLASFCYCICISNGCYQCISLFPTSTVNKKKKTPTQFPALLLASLAVHMQFTISRTTGGQSAPFFWLNHLPHKP
ncbi:hypothetical protein L208DRAFT_547912 [Tricholoma matsutake]|nr:hypothetical protein L208DRAFT_547912 [Tricholoma matsutake 945]